MVPSGGNSRSCCESRRWIRQTASAKTCLWTGAQRRTKSVRERAVKKTHKESSASFLPYSQRSSIEMLSGMSTDRNRSALVLLHVTSGTYLLKQKHQTQKKRRAARYSDVTCALRFIASGDRLRSIAECWRRRPPESYLLFETAEDIYFASLVLTSTMSSPCLSSDLQCLSYY